MLVFDTVTLVPLFPLNAIDQLNTFSIVTSSVFTGIITLPLLVNALVAVIVNVGSGYSSYFAS